MTYFNFLSMNNITNIYNRIEFSICHNQWVPISKWAQYNKSICRSDNEIVKIKDAIKRPNDIPYSFFLYVNKDINSIENNATKYDAISSMPRVVRKKLKIKKIPIENIATFWLLFKKNLTDKYK